MWTAMVDRVCALDDWFRVEDSMRVIAMRDFLVRVGRTEDPDLGADSYEDVVVTF
jgi:hypothetical protein